MSTARKRQFRIDGEGQTQLTEEGQGNLRRDTPTVVHSMLSSLDQTQQYYNW